MGNQDRLSKKSQSTDVIRVLLASASAIRRAGLETLVKSSARLRLVGSFHDVKRAMQNAPEQRPDVLVHDLDSESSLTLPQAIELATVVLIESPSPSWTVQALRSGVRAILKRDAGADDIVRSIIAGHSGLVTISPEVAQKLPAPSPARNSDGLVEHLTVRELEVLAMLSDGLGNREIASRLGVSDHTIKFHISSILDKLGAATRTEAVTTALRMGLILL